MDIEKPDPNARATIFSALINSAEQEPGKTYIDNVLDEAYTVLSAAADTTGNAMTTMVRHVVSDQKIYRKLHEELKAAFPDENDELDFRSLEKLPYLVYISLSSKYLSQHANISILDNGHQGRIEVGQTISDTTANADDSSRLSFGVPGRLPRVVPDSGATFNSYALPAGVSTFDVTGKLSADLLTDRRFHELLGLASRRALFSRSKDFQPRSMGRSSGSTQTRESVCAIRKG